MCVTAEPGALCARDKSESIVTAGAQETGKVPQSQFCGDGK